MIIVLNLNPFPTHTRNSGNLNGRVFGWTSYVYLPNLLLSHALYLLILCSLVGGFNVCPFTRVSQQRAADGEFVT
jgi:hypothetical protein